MEEAEWHSGFKSLGPRKLADAPPPPPAPIRRFGSADLSKHGGWILRRLTAAYPAKGEQNIAGWLRGTIDANDSLFLYMEHGVALFQLLSTDTLVGKPMVYERFVFAEEGFTREAAALYSEAERWAKSMGVEQIIVEQMTDIDHELIKERLGRLFTRQQVFARV